MLHLDQFDARASPFVPAAVRSHCPGPRRSTTSALRGEKFPFLVDRNERFRQNLYLREVKPYLWAALSAYLRNCSCIALPHASLHSYECLPLACPSCAAEIRLIALMYRDVRMPREAGCRERP